MDKIREVADGVLTVILFVLFVIVVIVPYFAFMAVITSAQGFKEIGKEESPRIKNFGSYIKHVFKTINEIF